jgi:hypothetical protein
MGLASVLALYASTPLPQALAMQPSVARRFFDGKTFDDWRRGREHEAKVQVAVVNRLNDVIRSLGVVAKTVAKAR